MSRTCLINMLASYHFISLKGAEFLSVVKKLFLFCSCMLYSLNSVITINLNTNLSHIVDELKQDKCQAPL